MTQNRESFAIQEEKNRDSPLFFFVAPTGLH